MQKYLEVLLPRPQNLSEIEELHWEWKRRMMEFAITHSDEYEIEEKRACFVIEHMRSQEASQLLLQQYANDPRAEVACGLISAVICFQHGQHDLRDMPLLFTYEGLTKILIAELLFNDIQTLIVEYSKLKERSTAHQIKEPSKQHQGD